MRVKFTLGDDASRNAALSQLTGNGFELAEEHITGGGEAFLVGRKPVRDYATELEAASTLAGVKSLMAEYIRGV